jgi:hypothetical protein
LLKLLKKLFIILPLILPEMVFLVQLRQNSWTYFAGNGAFGAIAAK